MMKKKILKDFLEINKKNDFIINEIRVDHLKISKNNEEIINTLDECVVWFDVIKDSVNNLDIETLSKSQIYKLKRVIKASCKKYIEKESLYLELFNKLNNLDGLKQLWTIFGYFIFNDHKEIHINEHIKKFWDFYNLNKNNKSNSSFFSIYFFS
jgi:hypothetical protein